MSDQIELNIGKLGKTQNSSLAGGDPWSDLWLTIMLLEITNHGSMVNDRDLQQKPSNLQFEHVVGQLGWQPLPKLATMALALKVMFNF